jgi:5-methylcytosine-specific restriction endonuclease McrA
MEEPSIDEVRSRAGNACEYCRIPQAFYPAPFQIDHIIARKHAGISAARNLALACLHCNAHKGPNIAGMDPKRRRLTALFNPRRQKWERHFRWAGACLVRRTAIGRATVAVLNMNGDYLLRLRQELLQEGLFPAGRSTNEV